MMGNYKAAPLSGRSFFPCMARFRDNANQAVHRVENGIGQQRCIINRLFMAGRNIFRYALLAVAEVDCAGLMRLLNDRSVRMMNHLCAQTDISRMKQGR